MFSHSQLGDHREAGVTLGSKYGFDVSLGGTQFQAGAPRKDLN